MDEIQTYREPAAPPNPTRPGPTAVIVNPATVKNTSNYLRALRRRFWMVLAVALPLAIGSSIVVLRMPLVYLVKAEIEINPPEVDPVFSTLVSHELGRRDPSSLANYIPNQEARLRSRWLAELVVNDPAINAELTQYADPATELFKSLAIVQWKKTNSFIVSLEGLDPARTKRLLEKLLEEFRYQSKTENEKKLDAAKEYARQNLSSLNKALAAQEREMNALLKDTRTIGPNGRSIIEDRYVSLATVLSQKQMKLADIQQQMLLPKVEFDSGTSARSAKLAKLEEQIEEYTGTRLREHQNTIARNLNSESVGCTLCQAARQPHGSRRDKLLSVRTEMASTPQELLMDRLRQEIDADEAAQEKLLIKMQESMPEYQQFMALLSDRADKKKQIVEMEGRLTKFEIVEEAIVSNECVKIPPNAVVEPTTPLKPNRPLLIGFGLVLSFGLGIGLVCLLERIDHSVKVPEHVTHGLTLPLLGVVPRIRRTALTQRGGHLWTPATPDSLESDAYRNIRASLLGIADKRGPITTLLVTSAKAGEGKSTTAINLAATCARAGGPHRLLVDIDSCAWPKLGRGLQRGRCRRSRADRPDVLRDVSCPGNERSATRRFQTSTSSPPATRDRSRSRFSVLESCVNY